MKKPKLKIMVIVLIIILMNSKLFSYINAMGTDTLIVNEISIDDRSIQEQMFEKITKEYNAKLLEQQTIMFNEIVKEPTNKQNNRWEIILTDEEIDLLAKIVWLESRGEPSEGQISVTEVILNRMIFEKEFKGTLTEVLSQKNQFSSWKNRSIATPSGKEYESIFKVLYGDSNILTKDYVFFSTFPRNNNGTIKIGNHYFCKYE